MALIERAPWIPHETEEDKKNERQVISMLKGIWPYFDFIKLADRAKCDYEARLCDKPFVYLEIRCRSNERKKFETFIINKEKIDHLLDQSKNYMLGSFIAVRWTDVLGYCSVASLPQQVLLNSRLGGGGRNNRNDPNDIQMVVDIPVDLFNLIPLAP